MFFSYNSAVRECARMNHPDGNGYTIVKRWYGWIVVLYDEEIKRYKHYKEIKQ